MPAGIPRPPTVENVSSTLSSGITDSGTTVSVADASSIIAPCYLVIDRVDSSGNLKSTSLWEYIKVTNVSSNDLTVTRGVNGSTAQAHSSGAVIEAVVTSAHFEEWYDVLNPEHTSAGGHVITGNMTVAGMNLLSVATIRYGAFTTRIDVSTASVTGIPLVPVFSFVGALSGVTVSPQTALVMPRTGTWSFANVITRTVASGVSAIVDINKNGTSIFNDIGRPLIAAGGTFVSTASIATKNFTRGDRITWDYDGTGGLITDFNVMLVSV